MLVLKGRITASKTPPTAPDMSCRYEADTNLTQRTTQNPGATGAGRWSGAPLTAQVRLQAVCYSLYICRWKNVEALNCIVPPFSLPDTTTSGESMSAWTPVLYVVGVIVLLLLILLLMKHERWVIPAYLTWRLMTDGESTIKQSSISSKITNVEKILLNQCFIVDF